MTGSRKSSTQVSPTRRMSPPPLVTSRQQYPRRQLFHRQGFCADADRGRPVSVRRHQIRPLKGRHLRQTRADYPQAHSDPRCRSEILRSQETDQPYAQCQVRLRIAWSSFVREFGPINFTSVSTTTDEESGEVRETHRRPNLSPFLDDPDCWLVASIEDYDLETNTAKPGPIFTERVISPPAPPIITSALDALAVVLNERGHVDPDHIAELLHSDTTSVITSSALPSSAILAMERGRRRTPICPALFAPSSNSQKPLLR